MDSMIHSILEYLGKTSSKDIREAERIFHISNNRDFVESWYDFLGLPHDGASIDIYVDNINQKISPRFFVAKRLAEISKHDYETTPYYEARNQNAGKIEYSKDYVDWYPEQAGLLIGVKCNSNCIMCWNRKIKYDFDWMPLTYYKKLIINCQHLISKIDIISFGEPFLHPEIQAFLNIAEEEELHTNIVTNGSLIRPYIKTIAAMKGSISFSIDAATNDTYKNIRRGLNFEVVLGNLRELVKHRNKIGNPYRTIGINYVVFKTNINEMKPLIDLADDIGVDSISFIKAEGLDITNAKGLDVSPYDPRLTEAVEYGRSTNIVINDYCTEQHISRPRIDDKVFCVEPWQRIYMFPNGNIYPCCKSSPSELLGNIAATKSFDEIWNGNAAKNIRSAIRNKQVDKYYGCKKCLSTLL